MFEDKSESKSVERVARQAKNKLFCDIYYKVMNHKVCDFLSKISNTTVFVSSFTCGTVLWAAGHVIKLENYFWFSLRGKTCKQKYLDTSGENILKEKPLVPYYSDYWSNTLPLLIIKLTLGHEWVKYYLITIWAVTPYYWTEIVNITHNSYN